MQTHPSPHPSPLRGERVNPSVRGEQSRQLGFPLRGARCSLSLRERVRVRGNGANDPLGCGPIPELSNFTSPPAKPEVSPHGNESSLL